MAFSYSLSPRLSRSAVIRLGKANDESSNGEESTVNPAPVLPGDRPLGMEHQ